MATMYKTPGVYIEEIPKFPPSIAAVETAIPAFIGYTEKAIRNGEDIKLKPTRIESIAEYEELFGGGPPEDVTVWLDTNNNFVKAEADTKLYLYDSLRMFYSNGGGNCYIVSIGNYESTLIPTDFSAGLTAIEKEDEPTILLFPDATSLTGVTDLYNVQSDGLKQSAKLMDRVVICDLKNSSDLKADVKDFRDNVGINNLKYGAAYAPWINSSISHIVLYRNLTLKQHPTNTSLTWNNLTMDTDIVRVLDDLVRVQKSVDDLIGAENNLSGGPLIGGTKKFEEKLNEIITQYNSLTVATDTEIQKITDFLMAIVDLVQDKELAAPPPPPNSLFKIRTDLDQYRNTSNLKAELVNLANHHNVLKSTTALPVVGTTPAVPGLVLFSDTAGKYAETYFGSSTFVFDTVAPTTSVPNPLHRTFKITPTPTSIITPLFLTNKDRADFAFRAVVSASTEIINLFRYYANSVREYERTLNKSLGESFGLYKTLTGKASEALSLLPPSGAIAGVYASVDRERGVWKAPANVSLNSVIGPAVKISHEQQGEYNVDVNSGKSINIIRPFTGKGTLVWGARTLAGNDNEWRYISVRRFFNMVEESTKKATEQFVFEPNDANTWVKVQAMIENFLTTLWRQGALQGIKPEHAFYVAVGLGKTMTALDILEGRMIVEIGMAAVRPAEFIIIRFSHKLAES